MEKNANIINSMLILIGLGFLSFSIIYAANVIKPIEEKQDRYQIIRLNDANVAVIDSESDKIYYKYIDPNGGPTNWLELTLPN